MKKITIILLSVLIALLVIGCSSQEESQDQDIKGAADVSPQVPTEIPVDVVPETEPVKEYIKEPIKEVTPPAIPKAVPVIPLLENTQCQVEIHWYADLESRNDKVFFDSVQKLRTKYDDKIDVKVRYNPAVGRKKAVNLAHAAQCAGNQGMYWPYMNKIFESQNEFNNNSILQFATDLSLDVPIFSSCYAAKSYQATLDLDKRESLFRKVTQSPTVLIGDQKIDSPQLSVTSLSGVIDKSLASCTTQKIILDPVFKELGCGDKITELGGYNLVNKKGGFGWFNVQEWGVYDGLFEATFVDANGKELRPKVRLNREFDIRAADGVSEFVFRTGYPENKTVLTQICT